MGDPIALCLTGDNVTTTNEHGAAGWRCSTRMPRWNAALATAAARIRARSERILHLSVPYCHPERSSARQSRAARVALG
jgi:hypothetical protein